MSAQERSNVESYVIKLVQKDCFGKLYDYVKSLNGNICFKVKKDLKITFRPLKTLSIFCDHTGLLRSHSRIVNTDKTYDVRFAIILLKQHNFIEFVFAKFTTSLAILAGRLCWQESRSIFGLYVDSCLCENIKKIVHFANFAMQNLVRN